MRVIDRMGSNETFGLKIRVKTEKLQSKVAKLQGLKELKSFLFY